MGNYTRIETSRQRDHRLPAEDQAARAGIEPDRQPSRLRRALTPWFIGLDNLFMDAAIVASRLISVATIVALIAMTWSDNTPPRGLAFQADQATSSPPVASDGRGALGDGR